MASSGPRYQVLKNEEDDNSAITSEQPETIATEGSSEPVLEQPSAVTSEITDQSTVVPDSPPPYDGNCSSADSTFAIESPPLYTDIVKLPTYNESENIQEDDDTEEINPTNQSMFMLWLYGRNANEELEEGRAGTHVGFIFAFLISFIFNWIGFLIAYCMSNDLSSHYGAISGFGLSLVKWGFLMRHSEWSKQYLDGNPWFFYLFVLFGWVIFLRGIVSYVQLHRLERRRRNEENHLM